MSEKTTADKLSALAEFDRPDWPAATSEQFYMTRGAREENARLKSAIFAAAEYIRSLDKINLHKRLWGADGKIIDESRAKLDEVLK